MAGVGSRRWLVAFHASYAILAACTATLLLTGGSTVLPSVPGMIAYDVTGVVLAVRCSRHPALDARTRRSWRVLAVALSLLLAMPVLYAKFLRPFPSPGDVPHLLSAFLLPAGLLGFPMRAVSPGERRRIALDVATVVVGGFCVFWYFVAGPGLAAGTSPAGVAAALTFPTCDLVLLFGAAKVLVHGLDPSTRRPLVLLAMGTVGFVAADIELGWIRTHQLPVTMMEGWPQLCLLTAHFLVALAAFEQLRRAGHRLDPVDAPDVPASARLPYAAVALAYGLMVVAAMAEHRLYPWGGLVLGAIGITGLVVARQVLLQREIHQLAVTDGLTGLANRPQFYAAVARALARGRRRGEVTAVVLADLDGFKRVNDTMGHRAGDRLLQEFAAMLRAGVGGVGSFGSIVGAGEVLVGRLGGDEFAILLAGVEGAEDAEAVVRRVIAQTRRPVLVDAVPGRDPVRIVASFGIGLAGPGEIGPRELLHRADLAMYRCKRHRGSGWQVYDPLLPHLAAPDGEPRQVVDAVQLRLRYRPVAATPDGEVLGVEALVCWERPGGDRPAPLPLLPAADLTGGLGGPDGVDGLGCWLLGTACAQVRAWQQRIAPRPLRLAVAVPAVRLRRPGFADDVLAVLERAGLDPHDLVLKITDSAAVGDDDLVEAVRLLDASGIGIALDTGADSTPPDPALPGRGDAQGYHVGEPLPAEELAGILTAAPPACADNVPAV